MSENNNWAEFFKNNPELNPDRQGQELEPPGPQEPVEPLPVYYAEPEEEAVAEYEEYYPEELELRRNETLMSSEELDYDEFDDEESGLERRDYHPIRFRRDRRFGCLGGFMYAVFVISLSIILACMGWMFASDVLALNKPEGTVTIELPKDIFSPKKVDVKNEDGKVTGTKTVSAADIDYVAKHLKDQGLIEYTFLFKIYAAISSADEKMQPGTYELSTSYDYRAIVKKMHVGSGSQVPTTVTFPEGFTNYQIFKRLEANDICSFDDLMEAAATYDYDYGFLADIPVGDASRLEGYLFPDTYEFYPGQTAIGAIDKILNVFHYKITAEMYDKCEALGITFEEAIVIASMIEKEASNAEGEREMIASVIFNRLRAGMTLGIDATSLYLHPEHDEAPTQAMLDDTDDPYNTRIKTGLPPTAICNPGSASLTAALNPASSPYYYYALNSETGFHEFFVTYEEQQAFRANQNY